jgi:hypothetical protein
MSLAREDGVSTQNYRDKSLLKFDFLIKLVSLFDYFLKLKFQNSVKYLTFVKKSECDCREFHLWDFFLLDVFSSNLTRIY